MGKRRRKQKLLTEPVFNGPIAVLLIGEGHTMTRQQLINYLGSLVTEVKAKRPKK